jgi:hypothetical protein
MPEYQDFDYGLHKQRVRTVALEAGDLGILNVNLAAGAGVFSTRVQLLGFTHFAGILVATTPAATTLSVRVNPRISFVDPLDEFVVAAIAAPASAVARRYSFYWGEARGLLTAVTAGSTWCFSRTFRIVIRNTGAAVANLVSLERLEAV